MHLTVKDGATLYNPDGSQCAGSGETINANLDDPLVRLKLRTQMNKLRTASDAEAGTCKVTVDADAGSPVDRMIGGGAKSAKKPKAVEKQESLGDPEE